MLYGPRRKSGEGRSQQQLGVRRVHKTLYFPQPPRQNSRRQGPAQRKKRLQQQRRNNRAIFHRAERRRIRAKISDAQLGAAIRAYFWRWLLARIFRRTHFPLRAIAISPRRRSVRRDVSRPVNLPNPPQSFAQNLSFD